MSDRPAGQILDGLGVTLPLEEGDLVADALVLAKVIKADGTVTIVIASSDSLDWITRRGLLYAADEILRSNAIENLDE